MKFDFSSNQQISTNFEKKQEEVIAKLQELTYVFQIFTLILMNLIEKYQYSNEILIHILLDIAFFSLTNERREEENTILNGFTAQEETMQNEVSEDMPAVIVGSDDSFEHIEAEVNSCEESINLTPVDPDIVDSTAECDASNSPNAILNAEANDQKSVRRLKRKSTSDDNLDSGNSSKRRRFKVGSAPLWVGKDGEPMRRSRVKKLKCEYPLCNYEGRDNYHLNRHINSRHSNVRPFKCEICSEGFKREDHLKRHALICSRRFKTHEKLSHQTNCTKKNISMPIYSIKEGTLSRAL